jgi:hypothetical protein
LATPKEQNRVVETTPKALGMAETNPVWLGVGSATGQTLTLFFFFYLFSPWDGHK